MKCIVCGKEHDDGICPVCGYTGEKANDPHYLQIGATLSDGKYTIGETVGAGGFGVTYAAWNHVLDCKVAIKEFMPGEFSTRMPSTQLLTIYGGEKKEQFNAGLERFFDESKRLAKFTEVTGIVQIYDCFKENNTAYIVMEFLDGETLDEKIKREGKLTFEQVMEIMTPVLDALEKVHEEGIIHRDIAPNNIMITNDGTVKLLDFGAARGATGSHSKSLSVMFKEGFTAEEQYRSNGNQGPWTDVYASAATIYKALTGITPEGSMERKAKDELKPPSKCGADISAAVDTAIMNAMNVLSDKRTKDVTTFKNELLGKGLVRKHYERTEEKRTGTIPAKVWVMGGIGIAVAVVLIVLLRIGFFDQAISSIANAATGKSLMPNVEGMQLADAKALLEKRNIAYEENSDNYLYKIDVPSEWVKKQSIPSGQWVNSGETVTIEYTGNPENKEIKDYSELEMTWEEVKAELENDQFIPVETPDTLSYEYPGTVTRTDHVGNYMQGNEVKVYVSQGVQNPEEDNYTINGLINTEFATSKEEIAKRYAVYLEQESIRYDETVPEGRILETDPPQGEVVAAGSRIKVIVSGDKQTKMPDLADKTIEEAEEILEKESLVIDKQYQKSSDENVMGKVFSQSVKAGTVIDRGTTITVEYWMRSFEVENLIGKTKEEAEKLCKERGIKVTSKDVRGGNNTVKTQSVAGGDLIEEDKTLELGIGIPENDFDTDYRSKFYSMLNSQLDANGISRVQAGVRGNAQPISDTYNVQDVSAAVAKAYNQIYQGHISNRRGIFSSVTVGVDIVINSTNSVTITYYQQDHLDGIDPSLYNG